MKALFVGCSLFSIRRKSGQGGRYGVSGHVTWVSVELIAGTVSSESSLGPSHGRRPSTLEAGIHSMCSPALEISSQRLAGKRRRAARPAKIHIS